jgi:hypothetical protein
VLFIPWTVPYFLTAGTLFHIGIYMTMAAPFFQHIVLYVVFIDFEAIIKSQSVKAMVRENMGHLAWIHRGWNFLSKD